jgi:putative membrane protein
MIAPPPLALTSGLLTLIQLAPLALLAMLYGHRARVLELAGSAIPRWRQLCLYAGLAVVTAALVVLRQPGQELLVMEMLQNVLIGDVAALLIVLGLTAPLLAPVLRSATLDRLALLANPLIAFPLWAVNMYIWHTPALYQSALRHTGIHVLEHALLLGLGINMWMCLFGPLPAPSWFGNTSKLVYILAIRLAGAALGNVFLWSGTVFYLYYMHGDAVRHISPLADQNLAGAVVMIDVTLSTIGLFYWLFRRSTREGHEREDLLELARRHGLPLSERRAARAIAAGRGAELRKRLEMRAASGGGTLGVIGADGATSVGTWGEDLEELAAK